MGRRWALLLDVDLGRTRSIAAKRVDSRFPEFPRDPLPIGLNGCVAAGLRLLPRVELRSALATSKRHEHAEEGH